MLSPYFCHPISNLKIGMLSPYFCHPISTTLFPINSKYQPHNENK